VTCWVTEDFEDGAFSMTIVGNLVNSEVQKPVSDRAFYAPLDSQSQQLSHSKLSHKRVIPEKYVPGGKYFIGARVYNNNITVYIYIYIRGV
jgi:hypothetical protein